MGPRTPRPRAVAVAVLLAAGALGGCGSADDPAVPQVAASSQPADIPGGGPVPATATTTAVPAPPPGDPGGTGAAPADAAAIRLALRRSPSGLADAKTARLRFTVQNGTVVTTGSGTADLADRRYLVTQRIGRGPALGSYGEEGRSYVETAPGESWAVTDDPNGSSDPLSLARLLPRATVVRVGAVERQGGGTCRSFAGTLPVTALLSDVHGEDVEELIGKGREDGTVPVSACIDDRGRLYSVLQRFVWSEAFGGTVGQSEGSSVTELRISDYGGPEAPRRPIGASIAGPAGGTIQDPG